MLLFVWSKIQIYFLSERLSFVLDLLIKPLFNKWKILSYLIFQCVYSNSVFFLFQCQHYIVFIAMSLEYILVTSKASFSLLFKNNFLFFSTYFFISNFFFYLASKYAIWKKRCHQRCLKGAPGEWGSYNFIKNESMVSTLALMTSEQKVFQT